MNPNDTHSRNLEVVAQYRRHTDEPLLHIQGSLAQMEQDYHTALHWIAQWLDSSVVEGRLYEDAAAELGMYLDWQHCHTWGENLPSCALPATEKAEEEPPW